MRREKLDALKHFVENLNNLAISEDTKKAETEKSCTSA